MIEFGGVMYYIDIEALDKAITPVGIKPTDKITLTENKVVKNESGTIIGTEEVVTTSMRGKEIDGAKYETLRMMLETLIDNDEEVDDGLGIDRAMAKTPLSYRLAFNTLLNYGILKEKE